MPGTPLPPPSTPPPQWALVRDDMVYLLDRQATYLGRSPECALVFDDPSISRRHASVHVAPAGPVVIDGGSRHGTLVNGRRIDGPTALAHGDQVSVGSVCLVLQDLRRRAREQQPTLRMRAVDPPARSSNTIRDMPVTGEHDPVTALISEIELLASSGQAGSTSNMVPALLRLCGERGLGARLEDATLRRASVAILRAAGAEQAVWIDGVVQLHRSARRLMHASTLDQLEGALQRVRDVDLASVVEYAAWLRQSGVADERADYGAYCLRRLEDIVRSDVPRAGR